MEFIKLKEKKNEKSDVNKIPESSEKQIKIQNEKNDDSPKKNSLNRGRRSSEGLNMSRFSFKNIDNMKYNKYLNPLENNNNKVAKNDEMKKDSNNKGLVNNFNKSDFSKEIHTNFDNDFFNRINVIDDREDKILSNDKFNEKYDSNKYKIDNNNDYETKNTDSRRKSRLSDYQKAGTRERIERLKDQLGKYDLIKHTSNIEVLENERIRMCKKIKPFYSF